MGHQLWPQTEYPLPHQDARGGMGGPTFGHMGGAPCLNQLGRGKLDLKLHTLREARGVP